MRQYAGFAALVVGLLGCSAGVDVTTATCTDTRAYQKAWADLTDAEMQVEVARACGRVSIGFKEVGQVRGVDPYGKNLTSDQTYEQMKQYLVSHGVEIQWSGVDLPTVAVKMPWTAELVTEIRHHPNVDYFEPFFPGIRF